MTLLDEIKRREQARQPAPSEDYVDVQLGYAILVALSLTLVHATLAVLARAQYGQEVVLREVAGESLKAMPVFFVVVYVSHPFASRLYQLLGFTSSVVCGCYIVYLFNAEGYYASMSKVPALATLCIWLIIELDWKAGLATIVLVGLYTYWNGMSLM